MSRFQFRGWSAPVKKMTYFGTGNGIITNSVLKDGEAWGIFFPSTDGSVYLTGYQEFMQCTGLQDKTGKDIYEGDIVLFSWATFRGEYVSTCKVVYNDIERKWQLKIIGEDIPATVWNNASGFDLSYVEPKQFEVIGNIHENPELLEVQP